MGMAKEYIERDQMHDILAGQFCACSDEVEETINAIWAEVRALPAADVRENVKARWEEDILDGLPGYRPVVIVCSNCHRVSMAGFSYCPNCGVQMGGAEDG
jgi:hypothetical protein